MAEFGEVLGPAPQNGYSSSGGTDELFPDAALQMEQNLDNGRAAFSVTLMNGDAVKPDQLVVEAIEIKGLSQDSCQGTVVCQKHVIQPSVSFEKPEQLVGGGWHMAPKTHDSKALSDLEQLCGCGTRGVRSFEVIVHIEFRYNNNPNQTLSFKICMECKRVEV